jgi:hypothetical protein
VVIGSGPGGAGSKNTLTHNALYATDVSLSNFNASTHLNLSRNGSAAANAQGVISDDNLGSPNVDTTGGAGTITLVNTLPTLPAAVAPLLAAAGGVQATSPTTGEMHLTQSGLDSVVSAAIAQWAAAGASSTQLALLHSVTFSVADLGGQTLGQEGAGHITIDVDAAGHGWFVDPTPFDNSEFTHAVNAAGTDLLTDPSTAAAGHVDLLTTVAHELGHVIGLPDTTSTADVNGLMHIGLTDGERRLPSAADVAQANAAFSFAAVGARAPAAAGADAGHSSGTPPNFIFATNAAGDASHATAPTVAALAELFSGHAENNALWWAANTPAHTEVAAQTTVDHHVQPGPYQHDLLV